jgi:hypothetical protein
VGIPDSHLYKHALLNNLHEYVDDVGLLYLPGYDVKAKFFYGKDSKSLVDHEFNQRTDFDRKLLKEQSKQKLKRMLEFSKNEISKRIPPSVKSKLKRIVRNAKG